MQSLSSCFWGIWVAKGFRMENLPLSQMYILFLSSVFLLIYNKSSRLKVHGLLFVYEKHYTGECLTVGIGLCELCRVYVCLKDY